MQTVTLRGATPRDIPALETLLTGFDLPTAGISEHIGDFIVDPAYRGRRLARSLVEQVLNRARRAGVREAFLLTSTAADYFARLGFTPIPDVDVDPAVRASEEFDSCCCVGAQAMRLTVEGQQ